MDDNSTEKTGKILSFLSLTYKELRGSSTEEEVGGWLVSMFVLVIGIVFVAVILRHSQLRSRGEFLLMAAFVAGGGVLGSLAQLLPTGHPTREADDGSVSLFTCLFSFRLLPRTFALLFEVFALFALVTDRFLSMRYLSTYPLCAAKYAVCLLWLCLASSSTLLAVFLLHEESWARAVSAVCSPSSSWESSTLLSVYVVRSVVIAAAAALSLASLTYGTDEAVAEGGKSQSAAELAFMYAVQRRLTMTAALLTLSAVMLSLLPPLLATTFQGDWLLSVKYYGVFFATLNSINCTFAVLLCFIRHSILCNGFLYFFEPQKFALILKTSPY